MRQLSALCRIPIAQSHNVTLLDQSGAYATLFLGPDRTPAVTADQVCTNHQEHVVWPEYGAMSQTMERREVLARLLVGPELTLDKLAERFLAPPLYSRWIGSPTVYTAVYRPTKRRADYIWPGKRASSSISSNLASTPMTMATSRNNLTFAV